ncbi:unnamed protein product [Larinioides sclopetarius]|uniref:Uncharacterized protein n=1 Tax=Larinioides sclopetarius TaxID=280406 RepID=A0AAV2B4M1_9ARAC
MLSASQILAVVALFSILAYAAADPNIFDEAEDVLNGLIPGHREHHH